MRICPQCQTRFTEPVSFCPHDGAATMEAQEEAPVDPLIGRVIDGRYRVEKMIGEGGMGVVYLIVHAVLGKRMALKVLRGDMARDTDVVQRFMQEAQSATQIGHQNIIDISDFGRLPDGSVYFVMEYLDGISLTKMISRGGSIPTSTAIHVIKQIASALDAAHQRGIIHRDLKPDNIYLVKQGQDENFVKVLDFGIAKVGGASSKLTKTGMIFGTPHYMSPEQAAGQSVDRRTDIYALGVIMYEMFTGRVPFDGDTFMGILSKHMFEAPKPPSQMIAEAGGNALGAIEDVILHALEKKPEQRYGAMTDLIVDLDKVQAGGVVQIGKGGVAPPNNLADMLEPPSKTEMRIGQSMPTPQPREIPKSRTPMILGALGALAVLGLVAGGAAFALSGSMGLGGTVTTGGTGTTGAGTTSTGTTGTVGAGTTGAGTTGGGTTGGGTTGGGTEVPSVPSTATPPGTEAGTPTVAGAGAGSPAGAGAPAGTGSPAMSAVEVVSDPAGAEVLMDGAVLGVTPVRVPRPTGAERTLVLRMRGYEEGRLMVSAVSNDTVTVTLRRSSGGGSSGRHHDPPPGGGTTTPPTGTGGGTTTPPSGGGSGTGTGGSGGHSSEVVDPWG